MTLLPPDQIAALQALVDGWNPEQSNAAAQLKVSTLKALLHAASVLAQIQEAKTKLHRCFFTREQFTTEVLALLDPPADQGHG